MKNNPKVSVIVLTYNQESTIKRTLDSILMQKCNFAYEIIIGDDASTDKTPDICLEYSKKFPNIINYIPNTKNKGVIRNYYDCILKCRGEYIADCAGDDYWVTDTKLQKQKDILDNNPNVSLVHTDWMYRDINTEKLTPQDISGIKKPYQANIIPGNILLKAYLQRKAPVLIHTCTYMFRRSCILEHYNQDPKFFVDKEWTCEDVPAIASLLSVGNAAFIPEVTMYYSVGGKTISSQENYTKAFDFYYGTILQNHYIADALNIPQTDLKDFYIRFLHFILMQAIHSSDKTRRRKWIDLIRKYNLPTSLKSKLATAFTSTKLSWKLFNLLNK